MSAEPDVNSEHDYPGRLRHGVPGWVKSGSVFHVRIRIAPEQTPPLTDPALAPDLLAAAQRYHQTGRWWCRLIVLMPDHLHALLSFPETAGLATTVRDWKRATARFHGVRWQTNFFDHRLRSEGEADEAWLYFGQNPVVKKLVAQAGNWPWRWSPHDTPQATSSQVERIVPNAFGRGTAAPPNQRVEDNPLPLRPPDHSINP